MCLRNIDNHSDIFFKHKQHRFITELQKSARLENSKIQEKSC